MNGQQIMESIGWMSDVVSLRNWLRKQPVATLDARYHKVNAKVGKVVLMATGIAREDGLNVNVDQVWAAIVADCIANHR